MNDKNKDEEPEIRQFKTNSYEQVGVGSTDKAVELWIELEKKESSSPLSDREFELKRLLTERLILDFSIGRMIFQEEDK